MVDCSSLVQYLPGKCKVLQVISALYNIKANNNRTVWEGSSKKGIFKRKYVTIFPKLSLIKKKTQNYFQGHFQKPCDFF